jgi:hypothetical protein
MTQCTFQQSLHLIAYNCTNTARMSYAMLLNKCFPNAVTLDYLRRTQLGVLTASDSDSNNIHETETDNSDDDNASDEMCEI